jgi:hypothetical protein
MPAIKGAGNTQVLYNAVDISQYINSADMTNTIAELEATVLTSTAEQTVAGLGSYEMQLDGDWAKLLDDSLGPDSVSGTLRTASIKYGSGAGAMVTYTWTTNAFITSYNITTAANDKIGFSATLRLNNAPTRAVT